MHKLKIRYQNVDPYLLNYSCYNGVNWVTFGWSCDNSISVYEEAIYWNFTDSYPLNSYLEVGTPD